ncbi:MAG: small ribosomal subunit Rsm22 family protein [Treponema sp.]|nr:small ribosomal subunit Rsm22 family protein [Treponema sp.]
MLKNIPALIEKTFPIPARFRNTLPSDIAELSKLLTNQRGNRSLSYLSRPPFLSAYLRYFMPWNLFRLSFLLPKLNLSLKEGSIITDLGCGPLTFTSALWIACPELRNLNLEFNCIDRSSAALEAGRTFFSALCETSETGKWKINLIKKEIDLRKTTSFSGREKASLVCAVNVFNETYDKLSHNNTEGLRQTAANAAQLMQNEAAASASILTVEPGIPQSGQFISFLRNELQKINYLPIAPCTHDTACPLLNRKEKRWCHFAFKTDGAPKELHKLSAAAKLPKERLALSFIYAGNAAASEEKMKKTDPIRIISDSFPLPAGLSGCYGCSKKGLVLLTGDKTSIEKLDSFGLYPYNVLNSETAEEQRDTKSGALIVRVK